MPNVLVVSYSFLPMHSVGVRQFVGYCRYLPEFGWNPVVLTKDWAREGLAPEDQHETLTPAPELEEKIQGRASIERTRYQTKENRYLAVQRRLQALTATGGSRMSRVLTPVRRAWSLAYPILGRYPDGVIGWLPTALERGRSLIREGRIDALISNCPPVTNHVVASTLAREFACPWTPYFGDLYSFDLRPFGQYPTPLHRAHAAVLHRRWMKHAVGAFAVSPGILRYLEDTYGVTGDVVVVGYDDEDFAGVRSRRSADRFLLSHVGSLYPDVQRPDLLFDALDLLLGRRPDIANRLHVRIVGSRHDDALRARLAGRPSAGLVTVEAKVSPAAAVEIQRMSDALLLFNYDAAWNSGLYGTMSYPSKVFEYMGAERPILSIPSDASWLDELLRRTGSGISVRSADEGATVIADWFDRWAAAGSVPWEGDRSVARTYTHREQARLLAAGLARAVELKLGHGRVKPAR